MVVVIYLVLKLLFAALFGAAAAVPLPHVGVTKSLLPPALIRLNVGAIKPNGWLLDELTLQAKGITGQMPYFWHFFNNSAWMGGKGSGGGAGQQYIPYYVNGLFPLSFMVDDANLIGLRDKYVAGILGRQNVSADGAGWLGPPIKPTSTIIHDGAATALVTKYWMVEALESYAEATDSASAAKVVKALVAHHKQMWLQLSAQAPAMNATKWGFGRYSDAIVGIQWLLDNGEGSTPDTAFLWDLLRLVRNESDAVMRNVSSADGGGYSWQDWFESGDPFAYGHDGEITGAVHLRRHGVDIGEAMKTGALWWRVDGLEADKQNPYTALQWGEHYLHMSDGMYFADEEVTYEGSGPQPTGNHSGGHSAGRGTETCSVVETMFSMRTAYEITGNITFMDRLERLAFNALPAALWPDVTANVYHHRSNQLSCGGQYGFNLFFCCSSNVHQGWPKFMLGAVQLKGYSNSTSHVNGAGVSDNDGNSGADGNDDDVVVVSGYAPSVTTLPNSAGVVNVSGSYPFSDTVVITVSKPTTLQLRIPCWTTGATVAVDDAAGTLGLDDAPAAGQPRHQHRHHQRQPQPQPCSFYTVSATSSVKITFDVPIVFYRWAANQTDGSYSGKTYNSPAATNGGEVEVHRGALTFALRPAEVVEEEPIGCIGGSPEGRYGWNCTGTPGGVPQFPAIKSRNVNVATAPGSGGNWSYGILPDTATFVTLGDGTPPRGIPFAVDAPPAVVIKVKARNLNYGGARVWADPAVPPHSPLSSSAPLEEITLVPFGATNIRISAFPELIS